MPCLLVSDTSAKFNSMFIFCIDVLVSLNSYNCWDVPAPGSTVTESVVLALARVMIPHSDLSTFSKQQNRMSAAAHQCCRPTPLPAIVQCRIVCDTDSRPYLVIECSSSSILAPSSSMRSTRPSDMSVKRVCCSTAK